MYAYSANYLFVNGKKNVIISTILLVWELKDLVFGKIVAVN